MLSKPALGSLSKPALGSLRRKLDREMRGFTKALHRSLDTFERATPDWKELCTQELLYGALAGFGDHVERHNYNLWEAPVTIPFAVEWDWDRPVEEAGPLSFDAAAGGEDSYLALAEEARSEAVLKAFDTHRHLLALEEITPPIRRMRRDGEHWLRFREDVLPELEGVEGEDAKLEKLEALCAPTLFGVDLEQDAKPWREGIEPEDSEDPVVVVRGIAKALPGVQLVYVGERLVIFGVSIAFHVLTVDYDNRRAYYPIEVQLIRWDPAGEEPPLTPAERVTFWAELLETWEPDYTTTRRTLDARDAVLGLCEDSPEADVGRRAVAQAAIHTEENRDPRDHEIDALSLALQPLFVRLREAFRTPPYPQRWERKGILWADDLAAELLEDLGAIEEANGLRDRARKRWAEYRGEQSLLDVDAETPDIWRNWFEPKGQPTSVRFVRLLARVLWRNKVAERLAAERQPALSLAVLDKTKAALWTKGRRIDNHDGNAVARDAKGNVVAFVRRTVVAEVPTDLAKRLDATLGFVGHRGFLWVVHEGHRIAADLAAESVKEATPKITIAGGFRELARRCGFKGNKAPDNMRKALEAAQHLHIKLPHGEIAGLLTFTVRRAAPGRPEELTIVPSPALMPEYVKTLPKTRATSYARALTPITLTLPPLVGSTNSHGAQARLQTFVLAEFRAHASPFAETGSLEIQPTRWNALCDEAGLPSTMRGRVLKAWTTRTRAMLARVSRDRYTLTDRFGAERDHIQRAGRKELEGRRAGRKSNARKRRGRRGSTVPPTL